MNRGGFIINGVHSAELNSLIQERPSIPSSTRKINLRQVPGSNQDYLFDEEAYENVTFDLRMYAKCNNGEQMVALKEKISFVFDTGDYVDLIMYSDPQYKYEVVSTEGITFEQNGNMPHFIQYTVRLSAKPFKRYVKEENYQSDGQLVIYNPTRYNSKPTITLQGRGVMKLIVNDEVFSFKDVDDTIVIDSETENAYKYIVRSIESRNNRMITLDFPFLKSGKNTITTENITGIEVAPKWVVKI